MFSIMTIASSTTKPVAMVSAIRVRLLMLKPARYITPKVPTSDNGTAMPGISVPVAVRRNRKIATTTSATAPSSSNCTSRTEARMVTVRSVSTATSTAAGSAARNCGNSRLMRSTTSITLAPGWRWILRTTAGLSFIQAASRAFSAPSTTVPRSDRRNGAPLRYATRMSRYCCADCNWSLASSAQARSGPSKLPFAWLTLALAMAVRTSSSPRPLAASAFGLS